MKTIFAHNNILLAVLALAVALFIIFSPYSTAPTNIPSETVNTQLVSVEIENVGQFNQSVEGAHATVLSILQELAKAHPEIDMQTKEYEGLGVLVTSLSKKENGMDNKYWQYYVDDVMPQVGADNYKLTGGESIEWRFEESIF